MDNVTHAFVGAAMAECAMPADASRRTRLGLMAVGVIGANAPDVDLLYTRITEAPLGYLLHHRGHTHTLPGLALLAMLIWTGVWLLRRNSGDAPLARRRWMLLIAAALASHLLMDGANSYGTHPFYPFSGRWLYLDSVFVVEPWLWIVLGTTLAMNAARRWRIVLTALMVLLIGGAGGVGLLHPAMVIVMPAAALAAAYATRSWERGRRAFTALAAVALMFLVMPFVARAANASARHLLAEADGRVIDVVTNANPGVPWCWSVLTLQHAGEGPAGALVARRGTLSLLPGLWPASACASTRLTGQAGAAPAASSAVAWHQRWQTDLGELRALFAGNCRVRAWLQFGRVPYIEDGAVADLRFESPARANFTRMPLDPSLPGCPAYVTDWEPPRRDVLAPDD